jgi:phosphohistidine phosphatase
VSNRPAPAQQTREDEETEDDREKRKQELAPAGRVRGPGHQDSDLGGAGGQDCSEVSAPLRGWAVANRCAPRVSLVAQIAGSRHRTGVSIQIVLCRHADAVGEGRGLPDEHRYLSAPGRQASRELGALLADAGIRVAAAVTSPLVRAVQTAELVVGAIGWAGAIQASHRLAPGAGSRASAEWLREAAEECAGRGALIAFGHAPSISGLAELLGNGERVSAFRKAEACLIEDGQLRWRLSP